MTLDFVQRFLLEMLKVDAGIYDAQISPEACRQVNDYA